MKGEKRRIEGREEEKEGRGREKVKGRWREEVREEKRGGVGEKMSGEEGIGVWEKKKIL